MDILFFAGLIAVFAILSVLFPRVGSEGELDVLQHTYMPPIPGHRA